MIFDRAAARCAAVVLTAALGCALNSVAVAATAPDQGDVSAQRTAQANPFADVPPNHWAYDALRGGGPDRSRRPQHRGEARPNAASRAARHRRGPRLDQRVPARARSAQEPGRATPTALERSAAPARRAQA